MWRAGNAQTKGGPEWCASADRRRDPAPAVVDPSSGRVYHPLRISGEGMESTVLIATAAMQAVLATPRGSAAVDDALISGAASKIFKLPPKQRV